MSSLKRWKQVGTSGRFIKWDTPGRELEGAWLGQQDGKYGTPIGTLETTDGKVSFPMNTVLLDRFQRIREGAEVMIRYVGEERSKAGRTFKAFEVYVGSDEDLLPSDPADKEDVPF